jgi:hypothetical protein
MSLTAIDAVHQRRVICVGFQDKARRA